MLPWQSHWRTMLLVVLGLGGLGLGGLRLGAPDTRDCAWHGTAQAFIDANTNGTWDATEPPLAGVAFLVDDTQNHLTAVNGPARSFAGGMAELVVWLPGCPAVALEVSSTVPAGYRRTTPARLAASSTRDQTFTFGFAPTP